MAPVSTPFAVGGYMLCSATLLISNKYAVHKLPAPSFVLFSQLAGTALVVKAAEAMGYIKCDRLERDKAIRFFPVALIFVSTIFLNMKAAILDIRTPFDYFKRQYNCALRYENKMSFETKVQVLKYVDETRKKRKQAN